ncbi:MAG: tripartite tricarboxylate transporter substrate binding protein [Betaproteobacteria bacterium]|nr:tripartite tricarboxylate transporter substrate binding protein [Betaproteobacteria bacterium]
MKRRTFIAAAASATLLPSAAWSQARYPQRPITLYGALPGGGIMDQHLRFLAERAQKVLGQPIAVDPRPGAGATLAPTLLLNAAPDGHTLAAMTVNTLRYPHYQTSNYEPLKDFSYVIGLSNFTFAVAVLADSPWKTIEDLIAAGKTQPGKLTSGSTGHGGTGHLVLIDIENATGAKFTQVPFKGGPDAIQALLGRHIDFITDGASFAPLADDGRVRILALATETPMARFKGVPTLREKGIDAVGWSPYGILGPKNMPADVMRAIHDAFKQAMDDPAHDAFLEKFIQLPWYKSSADYRAWAEKYFVDIRPVLAKAGLLKQ